MVAFSENFVLEQMRRAGIETCLDDAKVKAEAERFKVAEMLIQKAGKEASHVVVFDKTKPGNAVHFSYHACPGDSGWTMHRGPLPLIVRLFQLFTGKGGE